uniref:Uncharacterized protein n=1 Tax=Panagrolaimus davidi TaxID=227884 RepID=A0A914QVV6_9BILA
MTRILIIVLTFITSFVSADDPYIPCQSYISFSYDDSSYISEIGFKKQMNFIKSAIGSLNHPARLRAEGGYGGEFNWKSGLSISQMQAAIDNAEQAFLPYSLLQQFSSLATSLETLNDYNSNFGAMIFISDTSSGALANADRLFSKLKGIRLTFVLLGPKAFSTNLRNFTSNFLYWQDLSQPAPDNWNLILYHAYGCTSAPTPASTMSPIFPRVVDIVFILDDTNCDASVDISSQKYTISYVLQNYTIGFDGVRVANPHSIGSAGFEYIFLTDLSAFTESYLLGCSQPPDNSFTIDKYTDPDLYEKFVNAVLLTGFYNENSIPASECIDPIHSSVW